MKAEIQAIIDLENSSINFPTKYDSVFDPMILNLVRYCKNYEPEVNRDCVCAEVNNAFMKYLRELAEKKDCTEETKHFCMYKLQENLKHYLQWSPFNPGILAKMYLRIHNFLNHPEVYSNPFETMGPEYILQVYDGYMRFINYMHTEDFRTIVNRRILPYFEQSFHENLQGGHINDRKIDAIFALMDELDMKVSEEFVLLCESGKEIIREGQKPPDESIESDEFTSE